MLDETHEHDWRTEAVRTGTGCVLRCGCGALVLVLLVGGKVRPDVIWDGGHAFTRLDGETIVQLAAAAIGPSA